MLVSQTGVAPAWGSGLVWPWVQGVPTTIRKLMPVWLGGTPTVRFAGLGAKPDREGATRQLPGETCST